MEENPIDARIGSSSLQREELDAQIMAAEKEEREAEEARLWAKEEA